MSDLDALFRPFSHGRLRLDNRLVMAPMSRYFCPGGIPTPELAAYYRRRAEGGCGLIITEGTYIDHPSAESYENVPRFHGEAALAGWAQALEQTHAAGAAMFPQLWHVGDYRQTGMAPDPDMPGFSPSGMLNDSLGNTIAPKAMDDNDIAEVLAAYARSAAAAARLGFDGVEIHGAHGYLIDAFLWERTNHRPPPYGGGIAERARFGAEVVAAVRRAVGSDFPICLRLSQWKQSDFEAKLTSSPAELEIMLAPLVDAGVDIFHGSTRRWWEPEFEGSPLNFAGWIKKLTGRATITVGSVGLQSPSFKKSDPAPIDDLLKRLECEEFDLVAVGRAVLSEPRWGEKIRAGEPTTPFHSKDIARLN